MLTMLCYVINELKFLIDDSANMKKLAEQETVGYSQISCAIEIEMRQLVTSM